MASVNNNISVLYAFDKVFKSCFQDINAEEYFEYLMEKYELSTSGVETLAYLLHYHPVEISEAKIYEFAEKHEEHPYGDTPVLLDREFIVERKLQGGQGFCFSISRAAYDAFEKNEKYGEHMQNCMKELSKCSTNDVYSLQWLNRFNHAMQNKCNEQFKDACDELGIFSLERNLQSAFWALASYFLKHFADPFQDMGTNLDVGRFDNDIFSDIGKLTKYGLATIIPIEEDSLMECQYALSAKAAGILFHGQEDVIKYNELAKYATIIKCRDIKKKELFFSDDAQVEIDHLRTMLSREGYLHAIKILKDQKRAPSIQSLLWGPPGTGKTETVLQLALESGRDIIKFDSSKVTGWGWGITEKSYRALFRAYSYVAAITDNVPILLLNEADTCLSKRIMVVRAIDKSENTVTNILLEEMENMTGILLATTNLIDVLDDAFDRRFLFKTELNKPDAKAREKIWKSYIPQLTDDEAKMLADKYEMSGAQIFNVVTKRELSELYYSGDRGIDFIEGLCVKELSTEKGSRANRPHIGF